MKVIIQDNKIFQVTEYNKKLHMPKIAYIRDVSRIYKMIYWGQKSQAFNNEYFLFRFNKVNGVFDKPTFFKDPDISNINDDMFLSIESFYREVFNIIKRRYILGYMVKFYKKTITDNLKFSDFYISSDTHKSIIAKIISEKIKQEFSADSVASYVENIAASLKVPENLINAFKRALINTFYDGEVDKSVQNRIVNNIISEENLKSQNDFYDVNSWQNILDTILYNRKLVSEIYSKFNKTR